MSPTPSLLTFTLFISLLSLTHALKSCSNTTGFKPSKAVYSSYPNFKGACGYFEYGAIVNNGDVTGVGRLYKNGRGCGACYHVRCTDARYCDPKGVTVVVTDQGYADTGVDFVLSSQAFADLAFPDFTDEVLDLGIVDVEYQRVSCKYPDHNLVIQVMQQSVKPGYLAIIFLYQGGKYDILDVEISVITDDCEDWIPMRRAYGTVWDLENTPIGPLNVRFLAFSEEGSVKWVVLNNVIPQNWRRGVKYDTGIQLSSIGLSSAAL